MGILAANGGGVETGSKREGKIKDIEKKHGRGRTQGKFLLHSSFLISTLMEPSGELRSVPQSKSGSNGWNGAVEALPAASSSLSERNSPTGISQSSGEGVPGSRLSGSIARICSMSSCSRCHCCIAMCWIILLWMMSVHTRLTSFGWRARASLKRSPGR